MFSLLFALPNSCSFNITCEYNIHDNALQNGSSYLLYILCDQTLISMAYNKHFCDVHELSIVYLTNLA